MQITFNATSSSTSASNNYQTSATCDLTLSTGTLGIEVTPCVTDIDENSSYQVTVKVTSRNGFRGEVTINATTSSPLITVNDIPTTVNVTLNGTVTRTFTVQLAQGAASLTNKSITFTAQSTTDSSVHVTQTCNLTVNVNIPVHQVRHPAQSFYIIRNDYIYVTGHTYISHMPNYTSSYLAPYLYIYRVSSDRSTINLVKEYVNIETLPNGVIYGNAYHENMCGYYNKNNPRNAICGCSFNITRYYPRVSPVTTPNIGLTFLDLSASDNEFINNLPSGFINSRNIIPSQDRAIPYVVQIANSDPSTSGVIYIATFTCVYTFTTGNATHYVLRIIPYYNLNRTPPTAGTGFIYNLPDGTQIANILSSVIYNNIIYIYNRFSSTQYNDQTFLMYRVEPSNNYKITYMHRSNPLPPSMTGYIIHHLRFFKCDNRILALLFSTPNQPNLARITPTKISIQFIQFNGSNIQWVGRPYTFSDDITSVTISAQNDMSDRLLLKNNKIFGVNTRGLFVLDVSDVNNIQNVPLRINATLGVRVETISIVDFFDDDYLLVYANQGLMLLPINNLF